MPEKLPAHPSEITVGWLAEALDAPDLVGFDWKIIGEDRGFTGVIARLSLCYDVGKQPGPASLIAKFPTAARRVASTYSARQVGQQHFERSTREVRFYQELASDLGTAVPYCWFAAADPESMSVVLLLEDLPDARPGDVLAGCSVEEAARVLAAIAPLHARWWEVEPPGWIPGWGNAPRTRQERLVSQVGPFLERYGSQLPAEVRRLIERLPGQCVGPLAELGAAPATVIHADLHLDNILFEPGRVIILDWQTVSYRAAAFDLVHLLTNSLSPQDRQRAGRELLADYHRQLVARGVEDYSSSQLRDDCRRALLWALGGTVGWLASADLDAVSSRERQLIEASIGDGRLISMVLDWDVGSLLDK